MTLRLRPEIPGDVAAIHALTARAFHGHPHSDGSEPFIIDRLRAADALILSLVAEDGEGDGDALIGHAAFSPVDWPGGGRWAGLGPVSVEPSCQGAGVGAALIRRGLKHLLGQGFDGCVVAGDPAYYSRFGFRTDPRFTYSGLPPDYFMTLAFADVQGRGEVRYHPAFDPQTP